MYKHKHVWRPALAAIAASTAFDAAGEDTTQQQARDC